MQNAKDSFYFAVRNRLSALNPLRTLTLRAVQRPGIVVEEAEAPSPELLSDVFVLRWTGLAVTEDLPARLAGVQCEVHYATSGTLGASGLDRGRALAEMDRELLAILQPWCTRKMQYTATPPAALQTQVFWTEPAFAAAEVRFNQLSRMAKLTVFAFDEPGEI